MKTRRGHLMSDTRRTGIGDASDARGRLKETFERTHAARFAEPKEIAAITVFLASNLAGNITGSDYIVDGGIVNTL